MELLSLTPTPQRCCSYLMHILLHQLLMPELHTLTCGLINTLLQALLRPELFAPPLPFTIQANIQTFRYGALHVG